MERERPADPAEESLDAAFRALGLGLSDEQLRAVEERHRRLSEGLARLPKGGIADGVEPWFCVDWGRAPR